MTTTMSSSVAPSRLLPPPADGGRPPTLREHLAAHGPLAIPTDDDPKWRAAMVRAVSQSGLVGRGGAGYPTAAKWGAAIKARRSMVVVNAMEGEPASAKDRVLIHYAPHLVVEGAALLAAVTGASETVICVADHHDIDVGPLEEARAEFGRAQGSRPISLVRPPAGYVHGEESALVGWLKNSRADPAWRPDKAVPLELGRRAVLVHNAETVAQLALIARHGPTWYRRAGLVEAPGTTLVTVSGAVASPGVLEVALGTPLSDILWRAGAGRSLSGALVGGYGGSWIGASDLHVPFAPGGLSAVGASVGAGVVVALSPASCPLAETARIVRYMAGQSAGQCGPCVHGLPALAVAMEQLATGRGGPGLRPAIDALATTVDGRGACRHPDGVVRLVRSALRVFEDDVAEHAAGRPCPGQARQSLLAFPETNQKGNAS
jgi:NADH:ubiquinone oxidoreductase subunit F (NADH-binding)